MRPSGRALSEGLPSFRHPEPVFFDDGGYDVHPLRVTTHELAHAFGLVHDFQGHDHLYHFDNKSVVGGMGYQFSRCDIEWLSASYFFNNEVTTNDFPGSIELLAAPKHTPDGISIRFQVKDADGLHQAQLHVPEHWEGWEESWGPPRFFGCKQLNGTTNVIEFIDPALVKEPVDRITLQIIDKRGGITWATFLVDW